MLLTSVFHPVQNSSQKTVTLIDASIVFEMMRKNIICLKVNKPVLASAAHKWQPSPVVLPGNFHGQRNLMGWSPWGLRVRHD